MVGWDAFGLCPEAIPRVEYVPVPYDRTSREPASVARSVGQHVTDTLGFLPVPAVPERNAPPENRTAVMTLIENEGSRTIPRSTDTD